MKKTKNKSIAVLSIMVLIIVICLIGIIVLNNSKPRSMKREYSKEDLNIMEEQLSSYLDDKIVPNGLSRMYGQYKGDNEFSDLYRSLYKFVNYLPKMETDNIETFYENNKNDIIEAIGAESQEEYVAIVNHFIDSGYTGQKYLNCRVMNSNFTTENGFFIVNIGFNFEGMDNPIVVNVAFSTREGAKPMVKYSPYTE